MKTSLIISICLNVILSTSIAFILIHNKQKKSFEQSVDDLRKELVEAKIKNYENEDVKIEIPTIDVNDNNVDSIIQSRFDNSK